MHQFVSLTSLMLFKMNQGFALCPNGRFLVILKNVQNTRLDAYLYVHELIKNSQFASFEGKYLFKAETVLPVAEIFPTPESRDGCE
jgi:hypothetical protein